MQRLQNSEKTQEGDEIPGPEPGRADETIEQPTRGHPADELWQSIYTPRTQRKQAQPQVDQREEEHAGRMGEVFRRRDTIVGQCLKIEKCQCIEETITKLRQAVDVTEGGRVKAQHIENVAFVPEGSIQQDDRCAKGSGNRQHMPETPATHFPQIDEEGRDEQDDIYFNAGGQG